MGGSISAVVLVGWYAQVPAFTQLSPSFVAMQFNTAVALGLMSLALLGHAWQQERLAWIPASLVLLLGSITLLEHLIGVGLGIDLLLFRVGVGESMRPFTEYRQSAPGRMAPNTALSLTLLGFALLFGLHGKRRPGLAALQVTCCLIAAVLGFVAASGYALGIPTAYGWGNLTRMALHTAVAITLLGIGAAAAVAASARRTGMRVAQWAPFAVGAVGIAVSLSLWQALADDQRRLLDRDTARRATTIAAELVQSMEERAHVASGLSTETGTEEPGSATLALDAARARGLFPDIMGIGSEEHGVLRWAGDSAPSPVVRIAQQLIRGGAPALSRPFEGAGNEPRLLLAARGNRTVFVVLSPRIIVGTTLRRTAINEVTLAVTDGAHTVAASGDSSARWAQAAEARETMTVAGRRWELRVRPSGAAITGVTSGVPSVFLVSALLASMLAALTVRTLQREREQASALVETARALTEQRDEVEAANRAKSDFLARMSHELRTPLNSVIGFANVMLRRHELTERDSRLTERIRSNGLHLLALINQVLDIAKIEAGHETVTIAATDVRAVVESAIASFDIAAGDGGNRLGSTIDADVPLVMTDGYKLLQVLINLIGNALKFSPAPSTVDVRVGGGVRPWIEVRDHGIGIPADRLGAIFEAFEQAESDTSRNYGGTGLGLAISKSLCTLMGHSLTVTSMPGEGSAFTIWLVPPA